MDGAAAKQGLLGRAMASLHAPVYASRLRALARAIAPHLREGDRALDVGCGYGALGRALMDAPETPGGLRIEGLERFPRGGETIPVTGYGGGVMPFGDASFDVLIVADVLHHEPHPHRLLAECVRVSRRLVIVKDHRLGGFLSKERVSLIDWAANAPYGVRCLYRYNTLREWRSWAERHGVSIAEERTAMNLYPPVVNLLFGRGLQYFAVWQAPGAHPSAARRADVFGAGAEAGAALA